MAKVALPVNAIQSISKEERRDAQAEQQAQGQKDA